MKLLFVFLSVCIAFFSCKKDNSGDVIIPPVTPAITQIVLTLSSNQAAPGDVLEIKASTKVTESQVSITYNGTAIKGFLKGDSSYLFVVPAVSPGSYALSIPTIKNSTTPNLTIVPFTVITNPEAVVAEFVSKRNSYIDSLTKVRPGYNFQPSVESKTQFDQLKEEWDIQFAALSASERQTIAYVLQKNMPNPASLSFTDIPPSYYAKENGVQGDVGDKLVAIAKVYVNAQSICIGSIPLVVGSAAFFIAAPNPFSGAIFLASWSTFLISREVAIMRAKEVGNLKGIGEAILSADAQKVATAEFSNNTEKDLSMLVSYRNLATGDAGIQADITSAFTSEQSYITEEQGLIGFYNKVTSLFTKIKKAYPTYSKIVGYIPAKTMTLSMEGTAIKVKGVSDGRISYSEFITGTIKKVKINSTSTSNINFNLQIAYVRSLDNKEFLKDIPCKFKADEPTPTTLSIVSGNNQQAAGLNQNLPNSLTVLVKDQLGAAMPNVMVSWAVTSGGGQITQSTTTGIMGQASNTWRVGNSGAQTVTASVKKADGSHVTGSPITFTATLPSYKLIYISGSGQSYFGGGMPYPMIFKVQNEQTGTYVTNLGALGLSLTATASIGYQDAAFNNLNNYCGGFSPECYGGYYYVPDNSGKQPYTLNITVTLKQGSTIMGNYLVSESITSQ